MNTPSRTTDVMKFRAATTREALEQIKIELGEDAFVLDSREVRTGGFLGIGATRLVEMSAAVGASLEPAGSSLNLREDSPARPELTRTKLEPTAPSSANLLSILPPEAPRATSGAIKLGLGCALPRPESTVAPVELSQEEPKIVHSKKIDAQAAPIGEEDQGVTDFTPSVPAVGRELEKLRAEMRELKQSVGTLAKRSQKTERADSMSLQNIGELMESPFYEHFLALTDCGFSHERTRQMLTDILPWFKEGSVDESGISMAAVLQYVERKLSFTKTERPESLVTALIGPTGVGKTTTIAKLAARKALHENRRVELVTLDTYRIAAVEQLKTYAEIIGANCTVVRSVFELDAVLRKMPAGATVFIDTTGRSPQDLATQHEASDYLNSRSDISKCLVLPATFQSADATNTIEKFAVYGTDSVAVTKMDETLRPAAIIDVLFDHDLPLSFFCTGQRVPEDISEASSEFIASSILSRN